METQRHGGRYLSDIKCAPYYFRGANRVDSRLFRTLIAALALACLGRIALAAQGNPEAANVKNPVAATPESVATGKIKFTQKCSSSPYRNIKDVASVYY